MHVYFAGTAFRHLSVLTITAPKMILLRKKYAHNMKEECSDPYCIHSYIIGDWCILYRESLVFHTKSKEG